MSFWNIPQTDWYGLGNQPVGTQPGFGLGYGFARKPFMLFTDFKAPLLDEMWRQLEVILTYNTANMDTNGAHYRDLLDKYAKIKAALRGYDRKYVIQTRKRKTTRKRRKSKKKKRAKRAKKLVGATEKLLAGLPSTSKVTEQDADCKANFYNGEQDCWQDPISMDCIPGNKLYVAPNKTCYNASQLAQWIKTKQAQGQKPTYPDTNKNMTDKEIAKVLQISL